MSTFAFTASVVAAVAGLAVANGIIIVRNFKKRNLAEQSKNVTTIVRRGFVRQYREYTPTNLSSAIHGIRMPYMSMVDFIIDCADEAGVDQVSFKLPKDSVTELCKEGRSVVVTATTVDTHDGFRQPVTTYALKAA